jgi:hypothetical protein
MELRLSHLTSIKQKHNEPVTNYIRRFGDTRYLCFHLNISDKDLVDLTYWGLSPHLKEKLERQTFFMLAKFCKRLWIVKVEPKNLEASLGAVMSLEMSITLIWLSIVVSHPMMRKSTYVCSQVKLGFKILTIHML